MNDIILLIVLLLFYIVITIFSLEKLKELNLTINNLDLMD